MSARTRDVYETLQSANQFSLRDVVSNPEITPQPVPVQSSGRGIRANEQQRPTAAVAASAVSMKLNFGTNFQMKRDVEPVAPKPDRRPNLSFSFGASGAKTVTQRSACSVGGMKSPLQQPSQPRATPVQSMTLARCDDTEKHEIMRLTGFVEDLTARLNRAQMKLEHTEANLQHTQKTLVCERQNAAKQNEAFKKELAIAHETESKLRADLSTRPQRSALSQSAFSQAVGNILADEQRLEIHSREVKELEAKISTLEDAKVLIEAEVAGIKKLRDQTNADLETVRTQQSDMKASVDESQRLIKLGEEALATIEARKKRALDEITDAESKRVAESAMVRSDMEATSARLVMLRAELQELEAQNIEARAALAAACADSAVEEELTNAPIPNIVNASLPTAEPCLYQKRGTRITGHVPTTTPGHGGTTGMRRAAVAALTRIMPSAEIVDARVDMSAHSMDVFGDVRAESINTGDATDALDGMDAVGATNVTSTGALYDPQTKMVEAVIGDLKAALTSLASHRVPPRRTVTAI
tara:strand:- start:1829 stop:3415 length:1587 start_codon:yes stop_codon:yes gene_type:complete